MLSLPTLRYFKAAAQMQNFTKAAEELNISQPALSHTLKQLQNELGCPLFNYKGRGVELNTYGKIFLEYVNDALSALDEGERKIQALISPDSGTVRVSCLYSMGVNLLPYIISDFRRDYPNVNIDLIQQATQIQLDMLYADKVDLCFCTDFDVYEEHTSLEKITVLIEDLYVLVNRSHRLADRTEVALTELDGEDYISFSDLTFFKREIEQIYKKLNIKPHTVLESNEDSTVAGFVAAGLGVAVIPPIVGVDFQRCVPLKISYPICQRTLSMVWRKNIYDQPAVRNFRDYVIKWLPKNKKHISPFYP